MKRPAVPGAIDRRTLLATFGASTGLGLAGCLGGGDETPFSVDEEPTATDEAESTANELPTATLQTSRGDVEVELYAERVPNTVENFVGLATGETAWTDPETDERVEGEPLYDDVLFHRVVDDFVVQTGDPTGTGRGGPGYQFDDEFHPDLRHDDAGVLSMANSGPDTNGSQFFITLAPQPTLDGRHAVFGTVREGMATVQAVGDVETDANDRPVEDVLLESVTVHEA